MFRPDVNEISSQLSLFLQSEKVSLLLSIGICNIFPDDFLSIGCFYKRNQKGIIFIFLTPEA